MLTPDSIPSGMTSRNIVSIVCNHAAFNNFQSLHSLNIKLNLCYEITSLAHHKDSETIKIAIKMLISFDKLASKFTHFSLLVLTILGLVLQTVMNRFTALLGHFGSHCLGVQ